MSVSQISIVDQDILVSEWWEDSFLIVLPVLFDINGVFVKYSDKCANKENHTAQFVYIGLYILDFACESEFFGVTRRDDYSLKGSTVLFGFQYQIFEKY